MNKQLTLLFLLKDDHILLAMKKRGFGAGRWNGVGGKVDPGETIEQAAIRECQEEINVTPQNLSKRADIVFRQPINGMVQDMDITVYTCQEWEGEPAETEEMAPKWFDVGEIPYADMWPDDEYWLPQVLAGKKVTAFFELNDSDEIVTYNVQPSVDI